eukprot:1140958-Pelagomonas_calceolata.AAC.3
MGLWRFVCHAPGSPNSPSPEKLSTATRLANSPQKPLVIKSVPGVKYSRYPLDGMSNQFGC